jgi:hypothetical protein
MGNAKARPIVIKSKLKPGTNDVEFKMLDRGKGTEKPIFDKHADSMMIDDYHEITYTLVNGPGLDSLRFAPSLDDVMWVVKGTATQEPECPKTRVPKHPDIYAVKSDGLELTVHNLNPVRSFYAFTLNFVREGHGDLIPYDPIYDNRNGGAQPASDTLLVVGGVALVGLALLFAFKERANKIRKEREGPIEKEGN